MSTVSYKNLRPGIDLLSKEQKSCTLPVMFSVMLSGIQVFYGSYEIDIVFMIAYQTPR